MAEEVEGMQFGHIEIFVQDPLASLPFYADVLGFEAGDVQGSTFVWLSAGGTEVLLRPGSPGPGADRYQEARCALVLYCRDLEAEVRRLESCGVVMRGDDGAGCPTFTDPDGNWFQLVEHEATAG